MMILRNRFVSRLALATLLSMPLILAACDDDDGSDTNLADGGAGDAAATGGTTGTATGGTGGSSQVDAQVDSAAVGDASVPMDAAFACEPASSIGAGEFSEPMGAIDIKKADGTKVLTANLDFGFGSGVFRDPNDPEGVFWAITDRGPNLDCDSTTLDPNGMFCDAANKVFGKPTFSPTIVKITLGRGAGPTCALNVTASGKLPIADKDGNGITGLPISPAYNLEAAVSIDQGTITDNDNGMDTEALVRLADGTFWVAEEYGPSLAHISAAGKVIERVMPSGVKPDGTVPFAPNYPVTDGLPGILVKRKQNRGFESLALSPDGKFLYTALQSPMRNPDKAAGDKSLVIRIHKIALTAGGTFDKVDGEWLYLLDNEAAFVLADKVAVKRTDLKLSEMVALGVDDLLMLERTDFVTKIYRATLTAATKLDAVRWDDVATTPSLEQYLATDTANFGSVKPVLKNLVFDGVGRAGAMSVPVLPGKIEGIFVMGNLLVFVNDNDFNGAQKTVVTLLPRPAAAK